MSVLPPLARKLHDQFVVSHGKSGGLGVFTSSEPLPLRRGQHVVIQTARGIEIGSVLCPATLLQARLLGATSSGLLLRLMTAEDEARRDRQAALEQTIFETSRSWAARDVPEMEILDVELLLDGKQAILQFVGADGEGEAEAFAQALEQHFDLIIRLENLASQPATEEEASHRCDKPDCGRSAEGGEGGCSSCGTGGGCSSCGSSKVDMREYFAHLRDKMPHRIPLA